MHRLRMRLRHCIPLPPDPPRPPPSTPEYRAASLYRAQPSRARL
jgi:hypothetical protein